jgi:hypothetical protein
VLAQSRRWAVLGSLLAASLARGEERPRFADLISRYDEPTVGTDSTEVTGLRFSAGHLSLVLSGRATPVRAGDETVGFFFRGKGSLEYR